MVYAEAARKTGAYMVLSLVLAVSLLTFFSQDLLGTTTGRIASQGATPTAESGAWILFLLGVLVGTLAVGAYVFLAHIEHDREE
jgi:hypothetical protein